MSAYITDADKAAFKASMKLQFPTVQADVISAMVDNALDLIEAEVTTLASDLSALDARVTALEPPG
jgi:hypothetical protein